jgi:hypothetical protein
MAFDFFGQVFFEQKFSMEELRHHACAPDHRPLIINYGAPDDVLITPEGLLEPNIRQGVFGQLTVPAEDNSDPDEYRTTPVISDVYFYSTYVLDSLYQSGGPSLAPVNCYYPEEYFPNRPLAVVRSNSDGYYQLPLEAGKYGYLVKTEHGFYVDEYLSSRRPGLVEVQPGEVSILNIHMMDCSMWMSPQ